MEGGRETLEWNTTTQRTRTGYSRTHTDDANALNIDEGGRGRATVHCWQHARRGEGGTYCFSDRVSVASLSGALWENWQYLICRSQIFETPNGQIVNTNICQSPTDGAARNTSSFDTDIHINFPNSLLNVFSIISLIPFTYNL